MVNPAYCTETAHLPHNPYRQGPTKNQSKVDSATRRRLAYKTNDQEADVESEPVCVDSAAGAGVAVAVAALVEVSV